ncbi:hemolysin family protein [Oceanobacillus sp. J11TS1]|uniref:hemolysin family protein n=1 Tax=Oceanobacillus sp. J11TS1 TaxID=2807191 RepID=UPI001B113340|nr:CNNM domain-containing protein [Oceanobacillus sp. J11TS1]GIO23935.1 hemolysin [Oceanobacillus sp. J11TS1]
MIIAIIFLLFVSLFFSGSETALTATNKVRLQAKANDGDIKAEKLLHLVSKPSEFITAILIGNNVANILLPTLVTMLAINYGWNVGLASAILTVTIIIFSEVIPKSIAASFPNRISFLVFPIIRVVVFILKPITFLLNGLTGFITKVLSKGEVQAGSVSKEELRAIVDIADSEGAFQKDESSRIRGVFDFYHLNVKDVLKTPRVEIVGLDNEATYQEVKDLVLSSPFTRYPVYGEDVDDIIGIFHSKYLIAWTDDKGKVLTDYSDTDPLRVYEFNNIEWVFHKMLEEKKHMAIVLDEYGGTEGIVTQEDIIEVMIGQEIEDEMDIEEDALVEKLTETEIICDGKITLHQLNNTFDTDIPEEDDVLAAYILRNFTTFPAEGDSLEKENLTFHILEIDGRYIKRVQIIK